MRTSLSDLPPFVDQPIDASWPLDVAAQVLVLRQLRALSEFREVALLGESDAGVHQLRVACRRLGVVLVTMGELWPQEQLKPLRKAVAKLARSVGGARDLDVIIAGLCERIDEVHDEEERALRWLWNRSVSARNMEQRAVVVALGGFVAHGWLDRLVEFFSSTPVELNNWAGPGEATTVDCQTVAESLPRLVGAEVDRLWLLASSLADPDAGDVEHEVRLGCKRVRYLLDGFATCLSVKPRRLLKPLRRCQRLLGELHDGESQSLGLVELLSAHGKRLRRIMREARDTDAATDQLAEIAHQAARACHDLPAEGLALYLAELATRRDLLRGELAELWQRLDESGYRERLLAAVEPSAGESRSS